MSRGWTALAHAFTVSTPVPELDDHLAHLFADLPATDGPVDHHYRLDGPDASGRWAALLDGKVIEAPSDPARALALLLWRINRGVIDDTDDLVLLHAGGVVVDGVGVLLPGDMEVGKTTLVAGILRGGAGYLSDEAVGLGLVGDDAHGYAKALSLDPGSWPLFPEFEPHVPEAVRAFLPHQWQVRASALPDVEVVRNAPVGVVVLPRFQADAPLEIRRLGGADALLRLAGCVFPTGIERRRILERLARLLDGAACYELVYSDLAAGVDVVRALVRDGSSTTPGEAATTARRSIPPAGDPVPDDDRSGSSPHTVEGRRPARRGDAALIEVGDEWVIHVAATDELHRVDHLGAALWERLDGRQTLGELIEDLAAASGEDRDGIAATLVPFVADLARLSLVE